MRFRHYQLGVRILTYYLTYESTLSPSPSLGIGLTATIMASYVLTYLTMFTLYWVVSGRFWASGMSIWSTGTL